MWASVQVKTPGALPLNASTLRPRLRIDTTVEDDQLTSFLAAAAAQIEGPDGVGIALMHQTWTLTLDCWPPALKLPGWPITGVSEIRYLDTDGDTQTLDHAATFRLVPSPDPARLILNAGATLPAVLSGPGVVEIDYTLGRSNASDVDAGLITALQMLAGHYYENREATAMGQVREVPLGVSSILNKFSRGKFA